MTKNKKGNLVQMLSPENYIRKKARSLPIFECLVAADWEEHGLPTVVIARKHTNGNITACTYMVDLKCLGVKDTSYLFNVSMTEYRDFIDYINENIELMKVDYALAHNIVLAGVEYADELGFRPFKDYESVTKFMLEEDTDEIELIEIECGRNGKPFYMKGPNEDMAKANRIIAQLEKTVGFGNFDYVLSEDNLFPKPDIEKDWEVSEEEDELKDLTFEEKKNTFFTVISSLGNVPVERAKKLMLLTDSMVRDLVDKHLRDQYYDELIDQVDMEVIEDDIPDELLGINFGEKEVKQEWKDRFSSILQLCTDNPKRAEKEINSFKKATNGIPGAYFLELTLLQKEESSAYKKRLEEYNSLFPDYPMIQLLMASSQVMEQENIQNIPGYPFRAETYFVNRDFIHSLELFHFINLHVMVSGAENNISKMAAFTDVIFDLDLPAELEHVLLQTNEMQKFGYLLNYLKDSIQ